MIFYRYWSIGCRTLAFYLLSIAVSLTAELTLKVDIEETNTLSH